MQQYQIGRKPAGPWTNLTPPIRGGTYGQPGDLYGKEDDCGDVVREHKSPMSDRMRENEKVAYYDASLHVRERSCASRGSPVHIPVPTSGEHDSQHAPNEYTDWAVQQGIDQDIQDYPSLDPAVQLRIAHKYRLLHQKIRDQGLYECRWLEYGKEMIRYVGLFLFFMLALYHSWYMTSAVFLGLFWVRQTHLKTPDITLTSVE